VSAARKKASPSGLAFSDDAVSKFCFRFEYGWALPVTDFTAETQTARLALANRAVCVIFRTSNF